MLKTTAAGVLLAIALSVSAATAGTPSDHGIEVKSLFLSAAGYMLDFRYTITDPEKAAGLLSPGVKPYLIDQASGVRLIVPNTPKIGPLRQTSGSPQPGRTYFALFSNPGRFVKAGNKVTVVIGDFRAENLVVK